MIEGVIGGVVKELMDGLAGKLPKPPIGGEIKLSVVFVIKNGKPVPKEGSEMKLDFNLILGVD